MINLFVYGSLQDKKILNNVLMIENIKEEKLSYPAILKDHRVVKVKDKLYPAMYRKDGQVASGKLIKNLSIKDILKLDKFEGNEYIKKEVEVEYYTDQGLEKEIAFTYIWKDSFDKLLEEKWCLKNFSEKDIISFMKLEGFE